ncbi:hypothetical protein QYF61_001358 [Mycteria americana]|uniref:Uncharacterized protein n=1 Tax=Mycteria americana TaxID=33587 RepID=A0AAN7MX54_MYCAM|nr:hypothetical protein QYF61_001358 [Mycteria americana]
MLKQFMEDCLLWEGPHAGAGEECEEEGVAKKMCDELTATPIPPSPCATQGEEVENLEVKFSLERREGWREDAEGGSSPAPASTLLWGTKGTRSAIDAKQPQFPQPLLIRLLLQTLHQLRCPSLHTLQHLNVLLVVRGPKLNTGFEVRPHQCRVQGHDPFPAPAGHTTPDTSQDAVGFLGHLGTLPAHVQPAVNQHPQVLFCQAAFQPLFPKPVALHGVVVTQVHDLALGLVKPHTIDLGPSIQPVQIPLQSLPTLEQIDTPAQLGVICKLTEGALNSLIQIIDKDTKQDWPQN